MEAGRQPARLPTQSALAERGLVWLTHQKFQGNTACALPLDPRLLGCPEHGLSRPLAPPVLNIWLRAALDRIESHGHAIGKRITSTFATIQMAVSATTHPVSRTFAKTSFFTPLRSDSGTRAV